MSTDANHDQELMLKKRARRRLVGAIALVILMIVALPQILQDRAVITQHEPIRITMPETSVAALPSSSDTHSEITAASAAPIQSESIADTSAENIAESSPNQLADHPLSQQHSSETAVSAASPSPAVKSLNKVHTAETLQNMQRVEIQAADLKNTETQSAERLTVQVGVYADAANAKRIQEQLKQAGFSTQAEKIKTVKGESIRLRVGAYSVRQDAQAALEKIKSLGLSGMIVSND